MYIGLSFKFHDRGEVEKFLALLERHLDVEYLVDVRLTHVYIQLQGDEKKLGEATALVKSLAGLARRGRERRRVPLLVLFRDVELARPIPPDVIADALTLRGYPSAVKGSALETTAEYEEVLKTAEALSKMYLEAEGLRITPHAKRITVAYAYATGKGLEEAVEELARAGVLNRGELISLRKPLEEAREAILKIVEKKAP